MNFTDNQLDQLFSQAREEQPVATFEDTQKAFITATVVAAGGVLATKGLLKLLTFKKWIIMISTVSIVTAGALVAGLSSNPKETENNTPLITSPNPTEEVIMTPVDSVTEPMTLEMDEIPTEISAINEDNIFELIEDEPEFLEANDFQLEEDSNGIEFVANPPKKEDRKELKKSTEGIKPYNMRFDITENTTEKDFEKIKKQAEDAGIDFFYKAKYDNDDKLTKLRLELKLEDDKGGKDSQFIMTSLNIEGDFGYTIAWSHDDEKNASHMYCGHTDDFDEDIQGQNDALSEAEELLAQLQLDELYLNIDSLAEQMAAQAEIKWAEIDARADGDWEKMEEELAILASDFEEAMQNIDHEQINELARQLSASSAELVRALQEEMKNVQIEIEKREEERRKVEEEDRKRDQEDERLMMVTNPDRGDKSDKCQIHRELREELVSDGLIEANAEKISMQASYHKIKLNGKKIPKEHYKKYKKILLESFDADIDKMSTTWSWKSTYKSK